MIQALAQGVTFIPSFSLGRLGGLAASPLLGFPTQGVGEGGELCSLEASLPGLLCAWNCSILLGLSFLFCRRGPAAEDLQVLSA